jgi:hypothetical protein
VFIQIAALLVGKFRAAPPFSTKETLLKKPPHSAVGTKVLLFTQPHNATLKQNMPIGLIINMDTLFN